MALRAMRMKSQAGSSRKRMRRSAKRVTLEANGQRPGRRQQRDLVGGVAAAASRVTRGRSSAWKRGLRA